MMRRFLQLGFVLLVGLHIHAVAEPAPADLRLGEPPAGLVIQRIHRERVASSVFSEIGYHKTTRTLELKFAGGGVYRYKDVPRKIWDELRDASSKGAYFDTHIRNRFSHWRVHG
jgi:hypothetical protein